MTPWTSTRGPLGNIKQEVAQGRNRFDSCPRVRHEALADSTFRSHTIRHGSLVDGYAWPVMPREADMGRGRLRHGGTATRDVVWRTNPVRVNLIDRSWWAPSLG